MRICIVTTELAGPDHNGGIGTANRELAIALKAEGHEVDVLYTRVENDSPHCVRGLFAEQVERFRALSVKLMCIRNRGAWNDWKGKSLLVMEHLIAHRYDLAMFDDTQGHAHYPLLARRTGCPELAGTKICVVTHSATEWIYDINGYPIRNVDEIRQMEMERRAIELADAVIAPSRYILEKYASYGWMLPRNTHVRPNIIAPGVAAAMRSGPKKIDEIVFFGRIETRKGVWNFCRVIDHLKSELSGVKVTFLGKLVTEEGRSTGLGLVRASAAWPFEVNLLTNYDRDQALAYLRGGNRLAVMPSIEDNSPYAVLECLTYGIPFLASDRGGGGELLASESRKDCLVSPNVSALAARLREVLITGATPGMAANTAEANNRRFLDTVAELAGEARSRDLPGPARPTVARPAEQLVLVVLAGPAVAETAAADIARFARDHGNSVRIFLLAAEETVMQVLPVEVARRHPSGYVDMLDEIEALAPSCVVFCSLSALVTSEWVARATDFLAGSGDAVALTGVSGSRLEAVRSNLPPFFSLQETELIARAVPIGNSRALLLLAEESNSGFAAFAPRALKRIRERSPWDSARNRLLSPDAWIHSVLLALTKAGLNFDLLPDIPIAPAGDSDFSPIFELGELVRNDASVILGDGDDVHRQVLSRLGYEALLSRERIAQGRHFLASLRSRYPGVGVYMSASLGRPELTNQLARLAHAVGQIDLAKDLGTQLVLAREGLPSQRRISAQGLPALIDALSRSIDIFKLTEDGSFRGMNIADSWSMKTDSHNKTIELHANHGSGARAILLYPSIDLTGIELFSARIGLPAAEVSPVRFRFELTTLDGSEATAAEIELSAQESRDFQVPVPVACRQPCRVLLSVEMADVQAESHNAYTHWIAPRFLASVEGDLNG